MTGAMRIDAAMADWPDLADELDRWGESGRVAPLWWRDDDAVAATRQLDLLLRLAGGAPIALAVIPALARAELAAALRDAPLVAVLQHGWQHANRAEQGKKSEYPKGRPAAMVGAELGAGRERLKALFGARALPVLVPPWNRFADELLPLLPGCGMTGFSTMASPGAAPLPPLLAEIDVHVDLTAWRQDRGFVGTGAALKGLVDRLQARRRDPDIALPIGILTHHLVMDDATAAFLERLIDFVGAHAAVRWAAIDEFLQ